MSNAHGVARDQLRAFIERIERLEEEKKTIADDIKDVYGEAKSMGFDTKILRKVISIRKQDADERAEQEAILDTYLGALGMIQTDMFDEPEESDGGAVAAVKGKARLANAAGVEPPPSERFDPETGEILDDNVDPKLVHTIVTGMQTETGRKALVAALDVMIEREEAEERRSDGGLGIVTRHTEIATHEGGANQDCADMAQGSVPDLEPSGPEAERATHSPEEAPEFLTKAEEEAEAKGAVTADPVSRADEEADRQRSSEAGLTDGRRQGGVEPSAAAMAPAPSFKTEMA